MASKHKPWRRFLPNTPLHLYQRSFDWGVLFYDEIFILEHFMILCTNARKFGVRIMAIVYMITHLHFCCMAGKLENFVKCMTLTSQAFSKRVRDYWHHSQPLFGHGMDYAIKTSSKKVRSCLNYIANNGPEKKLSHRALEYKWNFLKYAMSPTPYSEPYHKSYASPLLSRTVSVIDYMRQKGQVPSIESLLFYRRNLSSKEWRQLVDYIVRVYNAIDYELSSSYYGSIENMVNAPDLNTGEESDISETYDTNSYVPYVDLAKAVFDKNVIWNPFDKEIVLKNFKKLLQVRSASQKDIAAFLHISVEEVRELIIASSQME